jgi:sodium transport system permease protein
MSARFMVVLRKELKDAMRDRRALGMILLFVVMYPAILWFTVHNMIDKATQADRETIDIVVIGGTQVPTLLAQLAQRNVNAEMRDGMSEEQIADLLRERRHVAVIRVPATFTQDYQAMRPAPIELWFDSSADIQPAKLRRLELLARQYNNGIAQARLLAHGVSPAALMPIDLRQYDIASSASRSVSLVGILLGSFFAAAFFFALHTAMDATAGERERRSLEVLLAQPAHPIDIIAGKWLAAATLSAVGLTLELVAAHAILKWMPLEEIGMSWQLGFPTLLAVCAASVPLCLLAAAFEIALAMNARSFKEAQALMGFVMLIPLLPAIVVPMFGVTTAQWMYLVPVLANQTLLSELAKGQAVGVLPYLLTAGVALLAALLAVAFAARRLRSERYVLTV